MRVRSAAFLVLALVVLCASAGFCLANAAVPEASFPERWRTSQDAARELLLEWAKIAVYPGGGQFRAVTAK